MGIFKTMSDLFGAAAAPTDYDASKIEVLEGLEPVRHRPFKFLAFKICFTSKRC